jgi:capsular polysaccharide export protein
MSRQSESAVGVFSIGIFRIPYICVFLEMHVMNLNVSSARNVTAVAGWGRRLNTKKAVNYSKRSKLPYLALEDGFVRSFGTGEKFPSLSLVVDQQGIYYDSKHPSALGTLLASDVDLLENAVDDVALAKANLLEHRLSKYNNAPIGVWQAPFLYTNKEPGNGLCSRVLVVDQTTGDMSVTLGGASAETFVAMLAAAHAENPQAVIYIKTHPEVMSGRKSGYLSHANTSANDARTVVLRHAINPLRLIEQMDRVYVVTSTMGFEALLAGKPVTVFGMPWYAGWGVTDDRQSCARRTRTRSVDELFAAAYFHYTRYLDPLTHQRGTIFNVIDWLVHQREVQARFSSPAGQGRMICIGFRRWKATNIKPLLSLDSTRVIFVSNVQKAKALAVGPDDRLICWGRDAPTGLVDLANQSSARVLRMEDGFMRSVGLGSDLIRPMSLVLDATGIYFDPAQPSDLEQILGTAQFTAKELESARRVRAFIVEHHITKYNIEPYEKATWSNGDKLVVLVPGQVEDNASIQYGCTDVKTNLGLLQATRNAHPEAFIVYKPHPDVVSGNRAGKLALVEAHKFADHVEGRLSIVSCIEACDVVHTMTSLAGFDALLRGKRVVVYGQPFYSGWGLTEDRVQKSEAFARRAERLERLSLDELVAGTLLRYPIYWDWELKGFTTCEAVLHRIIEIRSALEVHGGLEQMRIGFARRQLRKAKILLKAWF